MTTAVAPEQIRALLRMLLHHGRVSPEDVAARAGYSAKTVTRFLDGEPVDDAVTLEESIACELAGPSLMRLVASEAGPDSDARRAIVAALRSIVDHLALVESSGEECDRRSVASITLGIDAGLRLGAYRYLSGAPSLDAEAERSLTEFVAPRERTRGRSGNAFEHVVRSLMARSGSTPFESVFEDSDMPSRRSLDSWMHGHRPVSRAGVSALAAVLSKRGTEGNSEERDRLELELRCAAAVQDLQLRSGVDSGEVRRGLRVMVECSRGTQATLACQPWPKGLVVDLLLRGMAAPLGRRILRGGAVEARELAVGSLMLALASDHVTATMFGAIAGALGDALRSIPTNADLFTSSGWAVSDALDADLLGSQMRVVSALDTATGLTPVLRQNIAAGRLLGSLAKRVTLDCSGQDALIGRRRIRFLHATPGGEETGQRAGAGSTRPIDRAPDRLTRRDLARRW